MPEPFKNRFSVELIVGMSAHFDKHFTEFNSTSFIQDASLNLENLELKARSNQITDAMLKHLPSDFKSVSTILIACLTPLSLIDEATTVSGGNISEDGIDGWAVMAMADYIAFSYLSIVEDKECDKQTKENAFITAMHTMKEMTKRFSNEFAIRHIIKTEPEKSIALMTHWATDENYHVRRLVSEGSRPRLPWGIQLNQFVKDPSPLLPLLEALKDDEQLYVRRSVANNMNDIAKDHPELIAKRASSWLKKENKQRLQLVKHACRTLIKKGNSTILSALGFTDVDFKSAKLLIKQPTLMFGESIQLELELISNTNQDQAINIDYQVHHQKANGTTTAKVFKWKTSILKANQTLSINKKHTVKQITTRTYYPGIHKVDILINGHIVCSNAFELII